MNPRSCTSDGSGRNEIYVQHYPGQAAPIRVSPEGGQNSLWAPSGREIYYQLRNEIWAIGFDPKTGKTGKPRELFAGPYDAGRSLWNRDMLISHDGSRFLMLKVVNDPPDYRQIQVVVNWFRELRDAAGASSRQ